MISAEEWINQYSEMLTENYGLTEILIKEIQLDVMKEGMRRAAEQCEPLNEDYRGGSTGNARGTSVMIRQAILTAAKQLTEKDL